MIKILPNVTNRAKSTKQILEQLQWHPRHPSVFIKPNIGATSLWANTHPDIVRGIIHYLRDIGINNITVGDGSVYPCATLWELKDTYQPKNIFRDGWDEALRNSQELPCWICYCAGGVEWNRVSSLRGLGDALKFGLQEVPLW